MKLSLTLAFAILHPLIYTTSAAAVPPTNPHTHSIQSSSTVSTSVTPTPTVLLPPTKFTIKIVKPTTYGLQSLGFITLPTSPSQGSLVHITSTASTFYFNQKTSAGQGIIFSSPDFFTASSFALSYNTNHTLPQSKVFLSNLLDNGAGGLLLIDMEAVRMFGDSKTLYFNGIGNGLGGTPLNAPVVFSIDEERGELWVSTKDWKFPTVYLQIVPI
ncbi:uncharacterized protein PAC_10626 [Phialocephala subalpina]|uniref:Uncharacterized protein n=1 Tax=Phialocephala subalpina TaxID=576137 RepID=A0A1L7X6S3_9HELO|nr:uncharacterized protein PAC_10626 [Phialocephala subalpina]